MVTLLEHVKHQPGIALAATSTGRGLRAKQSFEEGDIVYTDVPLVFIHHDYSNRCSRCCAGCLRVQGTLEEQLRYAVDGESFCSCGALFCSLCSDARHTAWHRVT